jgi:hypothetical protein
LTASFQSPGILRVSGLRPTTGFSLITICVFRIDGDTLSR